MSEFDNFTFSILDSLSAHVAILDSDGAIVAVNKAWRSFSFENSPRESRASAYEGMNYLSVCENAKGTNSEEASAMLAGIRSVINQEQIEFSIQYPCHSPTEKRWFEAHVAPFPNENPSKFIVAHINITKEIQNETR
jgi:PAS domain-containing protein